MDTGGMAPIGDDPAINNLAAGVPEDPNAPMGDYGAPMMSLTTYEDSTHAAPDQPYDHNIASEWLRSNGGGGAVVIQHGDRKIAVFHGSSNFVDNPTVGNFFYQDFPLEDPGSAEGGDLGWSNALSNAIHDLGLDPGDYVGDQGPPGPAYEAIGDDPAINNPGGMSGNPTAPIPIQSRPNIPEPTPLTPDEFAMGMAGDLQAQIEDAGHGEWIIMGQSGGDTVVNNVSALGSTIMFHTQDGIYRATIESPTPEAAPDQGPPGPVTLRRSRQ